MMPDYFMQKNVQGAMSIGIASVVAGYCYSFGWSALSGLGFIMTAGIGTFTLFKIAELCISLKNLVDSCNDTVTQVNQELIAKVDATVQNVNELADELKSSLGTISEEMLPEVKKTLTNVQDMTKDAQEAIALAGTKADELLSGQMVLQLGTSAAVSKEAKPVKLH